MAIGDTAEVRAACDARTTVLSGAGWHVTPGLTDGHQHLLMGAQVGRGINFDRVSTLADVRALLRAERERVGPDAWITGFAFEYAALEGLDYHHDLVDEAAGPGPMLIHTLDMHTGLVNGAALRISGVTGSREFEDGSFIVCDDDGAPTGELREMSAIRTVWDHAPVASADETLSWYAEVIRAQNAVGLTGIHQMDGGIETFEAFRALEDAGLLDLRIRFHQWVDPSRRRRGARRDHPTSRPHRLDLDGQLGEVHARRRHRHGHRVARGARHPRRGQRPDVAGPRPLPRHDPAVPRRRLPHRDARHRRPRDPRGARRLRRVRGQRRTHRVEHIEAAPPQTVARFAREA